MKRKIFKFHLRVNNNVLMILLKMSHDIHGKTTANTSMAKKTLKRKRCMHFDGYTVFFLNKLISFPVWFANTFTPFIVIITSPNFERKKNDQNICFRSNTVILK